MQPGFEGFYKEPEEPRKVETNWDEDLIVVKVGNYRLGIEANLEILRVIVDTLEFVQELSSVERDQFEDDIARIALSMEGK